MYGRVSAFLDDVKGRRLRNVLVFTHGGVLACARVYAGLATLQNAFQNITPFGGMISIDI